ncbi:hypothetical protein QWY82_01780 [Simiduia curdlanivorans]|uniref:Polymerase nucleotidyl transferase domain-containing protein n=1 Tax=Simiduia curdlanivorans TaxID=1492769 RepID=A0ABV8V161_9GAMM|nr:hypothetical protein [Simiduia curdlanivorans]MDN3637527.1 hypothetical protein [Simiduia curdlanivorans]
MENLARQMTDSEARHLMTRERPAAQSPFTAFAHIVLPARWLGDSDKTISFAFLEQDLALAAFQLTPRQAIALGLQNPRVISPNAVRLSSLFHPLFFRAAIHNLKPTELVAPHSAKTPASLALTVNAADNICSPEYWLQSTMFLAGVTLGAAIIQNRWSEGTIDSKLSRLWYAGVFAQTQPHTALAALDLCGAVTELVEQRRLGLSSLETFLRLKHLFSQIIRLLSANVSHTTSLMSAAKLDPKQAKKFGFIDQLRHLLKDQIKAIIVYGSSINSDTFSDYDLVVVVKDEVECLRKLAGKSPTHQGIELNIGIYNPENFFNYQLLSGDNLPSHGLCVFGAVATPIKPRNELIVRNFSFGFIRMRQLIGMASFAADNPLHQEDDDKRNLYQYFVKIPLNVIRGIQGALEQPLSKEAVVQLCIDKFGFDVQYQTQRCFSGEASQAIASAAWTTQAVLEEYNKRLDVYR